MPTATPPLTHGMRQYRLDDLAAMRVGAVGAGQYHQLWSIDRRGACQLCVELMAQEAKGERPVQDEAECQDVKQE